MLRFFSPSISSYSEFIGITAVTEGNGENLFREKTSHWISINRGFPRYEVVIYYEQPKGIRGVAAGAIAPRTKIRFISQTPPKQQQQPAAYRIQRTRNDDTRVFRAARIIFFHKFYVRETNWLYIFLTLCIVKLERTRGSSHRQQILEHELATCYVLRRVLLPRHAVSQKYKNENVNTLL